MSYGDTTCQCACGCGAPAQFRLRRPRWLIPRRWKYSCDDCLNEVLKSWFTEPEAS